MTPIPESYQDILDKRSFAHVATKDRNLRTHLQVALSVQDPGDPYRYLGIQRTVVEIAEEGAEDHIHELAEKYWSRPFDLPEGQVRVIYKIRPDRV